MRRVSSAFAYHHATLALLQGRRWPPGNNKRNCRSSPTMFRRACAGFPASGRKWIQTPGSSSEHSLATRLTDCLMFWPAPNLPCPQFVRLAEHPQMFPGRDEDLLSKVFALTEAARGTVSQRTYKRLVPRDDLAE